MALAAGVMAIAIATASVWVPGASAGGGARPVKFADAEIRIEVNATDEDAGIQMFLDGDGWRRVTVTSPRGRELLDIRASGSVRRLGLTELFFESEEPSLQELPLEDLLRMYPEGVYRLEGVTADGEVIVGRAVLSHDIPAGPNIVSPAPDEVTDPANTVVDWDPVTEPAGIQIKRYEVIVEAIVSGRSFDVLLPASVTSITVPGEFLQPGTEYKLEVLAIAKGAGGNQTITETRFSTSA